MKIVELHIENVKRIKAIDITPDGFIQIIGGRNSQGKSSVLDAIFLALAGGDASKQIKNPVRDGEEYALVRIDLGEYVVTREWKEGKTTLKVEAANGAKFASPQGLLDSLLGTLSFDPLAFMRLDAKKQLEALTGLVHLDINLEALEIERAKTYELRTDVGRKVKELKGQLAGLGEVEEAPEEIVSVAELADELQNAREQSRVMAEVLDEAKTVINEIARLQARAKEIDKQIQAFPEKTPDLVAMKAQIDSAEETNNKVRRNQERKGTALKLETQEHIVNTYSVALDEYDEVKSKAMAEAVFPVEGLGFSEEGVTFNGIPLQDCSDSEKIKISLGMAMALNSKIRIIRISDGSLLDPANLALIEEMAKEKDYQLWIERVGNADALAVIIEDGMVKE